MRPELLHLFGLAVPSYGAAISAGFVLGVLLGVRAAGRQGLSESRLLDIALILLGASFLGARLLFVAANIRVYAALCFAGADGGAAARRAARILADCARALHPTEGGFAFQGGLLLSALAVLLYTRRHRMGFLRVADLLAPLGALGHAFGRLGCFLAGCCYGRPTSSPLGVPFPRGSLAHLEFLEAGRLAGPLAAATPPLHPTQLYEAGLLVLLYFLLLAEGPRKRFHGQLLVDYLLLGSAARFGIEFLRGDPDRGIGFLGPLSLPQVIALLVALAAAALRVHLSRRARVSAEG
jgi:phosphatidylglycerol---prolipoprotein diacylglyceryl transferase